MSRWLGEIVFVCVFLLFLWFQMPEENRPEAPRRAPPPVPPASTEIAVAPPLPQGLRPLPPPSPADPTVAISDSGPRTGDSTGTAFAIGPGIWATARHVVEECGRVFVSVDGRWQPAREIRAHVAADVAVIRLDAAAPALAFSDRPLGLPQHGFHIGYPQSRPGSVQTELLGRATVHWRRLARPERALVWAEVARVPEFDGPIGGISGAPVLDNAGRIVGVTTAASPRRGRVTTAVSESLREIAPPLPQRQSTAPIRLDAASFGAVATRTREADTVSQVYCRLDAGAPAPRRPRPFG
ncbi:S1 family peptidase [Desertibaculum subflavum]|uniref:S1 family peptidase n=1 Tax=Desertibaculum subflavum TaxID=2268458 RepID=UPI000E6624F9